ncbi:MAG: 50S ribosomal protein L23, partial [Gammaproteobacteria bacterium]
MSQERLMTVLLGPHVSEKGTVLAEKHNQMVFRVRPDASKAEIR